MEGCMLLYFAKSKKDTECKNFADLLFLYQYFFCISRDGRKGGLQPP